MKVLTTSTDAQSMSIIPRSYASTITIKLRDESTNEITTYSDVATTTQRIGKTSAFERGRRKNDCNSTRKCCFAPMFSGVSVVFWIPHL